MGANLAAVAVEVNAAQLDAVNLPAVAFACELEAMAAGASRSRLFVLASKIGLEPDATAMVLDSCERRATLLHQAHLVLRNLIAQQAAA